MKSNDLITGESNETKEEKKKKKAIRGHKPINKSFLLREYVTRVHEGRTRLRRGTKIDSRIVSEL